MRIPKDGYFAHRAMLGRLGGRGTSPHPHHRPLELPARREEERLCGIERGEGGAFRNGVSQGFGEQSYRFLYTFPGMEWQPGALKAVGYDGLGNKLCETELVTAGPPAAIRLNAHTGPQGLLANGSDLALVDVEVVDAQGRRLSYRAHSDSLRSQRTRRVAGGMAQGPGELHLVQSLPVEGASIA